MAKISTVVYYYMFVEVTPIMCIMGSFYYYVGVCNKWKRARTLF